MKILIVERVGDSSMQLCMYCIFDMRICDLGLIATDVEGKVDMSQFKTSQFSAFKISFQTRHGL